MLSNDCFLHYLLQKGSQYQSDFSLDVGPFWRQTHQLLSYLFPKYLQVALRKGLYKE